MMPNLNDREAQILSFISKEAAEKGFPPSVREICAAVGLKSTSTVHGYLNSLEKKGFIRRDLTKPRAIDVIQDTVDSINVRRIAKGVPLVGAVTAGMPILATENITDYIPLPKDWVGDDQVFMLKVKGDSMIGAGINESDMLIVRSQSDAQNGEIVVAMINDEATVKRIYKTKQAIELHPENPAYQVIISPDTKVIGKVIGLLRKI
ncbi:MAG TPA: transcriptional repressor LexA [Bacillota bacterium]|nr:transcriptional repressor LexA [Bacillota bacterium]HOH10710.1 transcriptional repressor LexA [Bacillota bacterium]HPI01599.1 transcriptional repressor LexA [Bacillota bacterium]HPM64454.1 transcriptional repressor LexA [Bacillota bacterium]